MIKRILVLLVPFLISATYVKYIGYNKKEYLVSGKRYYTYYSFDRNNPLEVLLQGDKRYKVFIRGETGGIEVDVLLDKVKLKEVTTKSELSGLSFRGGSRRPTKAVVFGLKLEKGRHSLRLVSKGGVCYARIKIETRKTWLKKVPDSYKKAVDFVIDGRSYTYYEATKDSPLVVRLKNPSEIKIYSRKLADSGKKSFSYSFMVEKKDKKEEIKVSGSRVSSGKLGGVFCTKAAVNVVALNPEDKLIKIYPDTGSLYLSVYIPKAKKKI